MSPNHVHVPDFPQKVLFFDTLQCRDYYFLFASNRQRANEMLWLHNVCFPSLYGNCIS